MSDWQTYINAGAGVVFALIAGFVKTVRDDHNALATKQQALELKMAEDYVTHDDLGDIKATLRRIEDKLDQKQDRH